MNAPRPSAWASSDSHVARNRACSKRGRSLPPDSEATRAEATLCREAPVPPTR